MGAVAAKPTPAEPGYTPELVVELGRNPYSCTTERARVALV